MPLSLPNLDDRRWGDLVEQGRALIPLYAPEWTDHNASDPGITLMELLAWVTETDIYRVNRITARQKRGLLRLMNIGPEPPRPCTVAVELRLTAGPAPVTLPASVEFTGTTASGRVAGFRSTVAVDVADAKLGAIQRKSAGGFQNCTAAWARDEAIAVFGDDPQPGAELYLGFDQPLPVGAWVQIYFGVAGSAAGIEARRRLLEDRGGGEHPGHHDVRIVWEYAANAGPAQWLPLEAEDGTRSLTLSGAVRLRLAAPMKTQALGQVAQPLCYVRCRYVHGAFDEAPRVERVWANGVELVQSVAAWQTVPIARGATVTGTVTAGETMRADLRVIDGAITHLAVDAASHEAPGIFVLGYVPATPFAAGSLTIEGRLAGIGTAEPAQTITLTPRPVVESTLTVFSVESGGWREWQRVDDFAASTRTSAHYRLDPTAGELTFGDGENGRTAPAGCVLFAFYAATLAEAGAALVSALADSPRNRVLLPDAGVIARVAAVRQIVLETGSPAETLAHATGRAVESREASLRGVTVEDIEAIARETPGTRIARAVARPNLYPGLDCVSAPGVVTVVVVPHLPARRPRPSAGLIRAVAARLERRRTIGTRFIVLGPSYLEVAVRARLKAFDGVDKVRLAREVAEALDAFFDPLRGGPSKRGWPLGRDVYRAEVMQVIDETPGVDHVLALELIVEGCAPNCGNVCLRPTSLVAAGAHDIEVL